MIPRLAWRNIWRNKLRSLIITTSVALGVMAGIFILAIYQGMIQSRIRTIIEDEVSHLQIHHPTFKNDFKAQFTISQGINLVEKIQQMKEVDCISPRLITRGMLGTATGSAGVEIRGVLPENENLISRLAEKIIEGTYFTGNRRNEILVGKSLAKKKGLKLRSKVVLTFTDKDNTITSGAFRIVGLYQSSNTALDESIVYVYKPDLARLLNLDEEIHQIAIVLKGDEFVAPLYKGLSSSYPNLLIETWRQIAPETELLITVSNQSNFIILIIIMLTLAFGIINTMLMAILERIKEIGMMIALGMTKIRLFLLVLLETTFLTVIGTPFGICLAWLLTWYFSQVGLDTTAWAEAMMSDYGFEKIIYPRFPDQQLVKMVVLVGGTAIFSSIIPAIRALKMEPADALRK